MFDLYHQLTVFAAYVHDPEIYGTESGGLGNV